MLITAQRLSRLLPVLLLLTFSVARADPAYKPDAGPHAITTSDLTIHDADRDKDLPLRIVVPTPTPAEPGPFPLIIFSHGLGGSRDAFPALTQHWASHGYIVILPTHGDSIQLRREKGEDLSHLRTNIKALEKDADLPSRAADITFILDSLDTIESKLRPAEPPKTTDNAALHDESGGAGSGAMSLSPTSSPAAHSSPSALAEGVASRRAGGGSSSLPLIDRSRIGMSGHSAGAFTTQIVFGVKLRGLGGLRANPDARIKAVILISGQGTNRRIFTKDSWADLTKPMLVITGSKDTAAIGNETPETRQDPFTYARSGSDNKYLLFIEGATHSSYSGQKPAMRLDPEQPDDATLKMIGSVTASGTLAFWDAYLRDDEPARRYLATDDLQKLSGDKATLKRK